MKRLLIAAAASVFLTVSILPVPALAANDYKMYHGSDCKVFGATAWTDLSFSGYGVKNLASSPRNVICPLTKDTEGYWLGSVGSRAYVSVRLETGSVATSYSCTVYVTTVNDSSSVNTLTNYSGAQPPNTLNSFTLAYLNSVAASTSGTLDKAYMLCTLGPQVRLLGYLLWEEGATNG